MKMLPIGIQSFKELRKLNCVYVDKTHHVLNLIEHGKYFFLSRPRRFGKSLFLSTLEEVFLGNRDIFKGLFIYDRIDWDTYPVIRLDFGGKAYATPEELTTSLGYFVDNMAERYQCILNSGTLPDRFGELISGLHEKYGKQAVVLIDEYDKPIIDHLHNIPVANANRDVLQSFYQVLKASDEHLKFVFLTGVSRFSKVSVFSGLNNLRDITMSDQYNDICGYTQKELEGNFSEYIEQLMHEKGTDRDSILSRIKVKYNGYSWNGVTSVYNSFSTLILFAENTFGNFWFSTGTPTFLIRILKDTDLTPVLKPVTMTSSGFDSFDPEAILPVPLLFQTGYLTVKSVRDNIVTGSTIYTLGLPNMEVHDALLSGLLAEYSGYSAGQTGALKDRMIEQLIERDEDGFNASMRQMFAHIPYQLHIDSEAYYHSLVLLWINLLGFEVQGEVSTNIGRIDAVWQWQDYVVVAEVKYQPDEKYTEDSVSKLLDKGMAQIRDRRYYERYAGGQNHVTLLAIAFAGKKTGCRMEEVKNEVTKKSLP